MLSLVIVLFSGATVNLSAPLIVPEQNRTFLATISLIAPSGGATIPLEIDINDTGITATPFCMFNFTLKYHHLLTVLLQLITYVWLHPLLCSKELSVQDVVCAQYCMISLMTILLNLMRY